jgi:serine/threonine-protein kinase HipA
MMSRSGKVYMQDEYAGLLRQDEDGYSFTYDHLYLNSDNPISISLTLPIRKESYYSKTMIPFFDGLIPEGWFMEIEAEGHEINPRDRMALLLTLCTDCIGAVSIVPVEEVDNE